MNCKIHEFTGLQVEEKYLGEVLRSVIHTVLFQRALGVVEPYDVYVELLDLHYVRCKSAVILRDAEVAISELKTQFSKEKDKKNLKFVIYFNEFVEKSGIWGTRIEPSESPWEQWVFNLELLASDFVGERRLEILGRDLQTLLQSIVESSLNNLNHLPVPLPRKDDKAQEDDPRIFPYKIGLPSMSVTRGGYWGGFIDKFLG